MVTFGRAAEKVGGFLALPRDARRHRAIIVIHEWWGLNEWVKEQAEKLAANGYVTLAVDLYQGRVAADRSEARKLKRGLRQEHAIGDMKAAFDYLANHPDVDPKHIGALGWSMGGGLAVQLAIHEPRLAACVVNYGPLPTNTADIQKIDVPVLGIFGALDRGISTDKVRAFEEYEGCRQASRDWNLRRRRSRVRKSHQPKRSTSGRRQGMASHGQIFQASKAIEFRCYISFLRLRNGNIYET